MANFLGSLQNLGKAVLTAITNATPTNLTGLLKGNGTTVGAVSGTATQYVRGDGTVADFPTIPALDHKVLATPTDTAPGTLVNKIGTGNGLQISTSGSGSQTVELSVPILPGGLYFSEGGSLGVNCEPPLGNPAADGAVLSSTKLGVRSWVAARVLLAANLTVYVAPTGSDTTGTGTAAAPWATIQHALNVVTATYDLNGYTITVQLADGTYTGNLTLPSFVGGGMIHLAGHIGDATKVTLTASSGYVVTADGTIGIYQLDYLTLSGSAASYLLFVNNHSCVFVNYVNYGSCASYQVFAQRCSSVRNINSAPYTVSGGGIAHLFVATQSQVEIQNTVVTITGDPIFYAFVIVNQMGLVRASGCTFNGSINGAQYNISMNSLVFLSGVILPGSISGNSLTVGGQVA